MEGTNRLYIGSLIPGVHPNHRLEHWPTRDVKNVFTYLAAWCVIQGIVIEKAWFQDHSSNFVIQVAVEGLQAAEDALGQHMNETTFYHPPPGLPKDSSCCFYRCALSPKSLRKEKFFHRGWPSWLSEATARQLGRTRLGGRFRPHPPPPLKLARTPDITVGWYLPLSTSSTAAASSANFSTVPNVATDSGPLAGDKRKHADSGASMPPAKRFKGADPDPMETDPEIVGDEMEGVEHTPGNDVMMDVDAPMEDADSLFEYSDDEMDVDLNTDDLNGRIRRSMLEVPSLDCNSTYTWWWWWNSLIYRFGLPTGSYEAPRAVLVHHIQG
ncbi:hypothetical protein BS47DRAFT_1445088 [Hydnum rufescens UP504]|uniref:Uncharacterized protein n=1 Tax=Hydnum rufescens UP504 TaxID=1448309 RepID=A0A9P6ADS9_9AGAM|nr:hypothetical protein BS47DRAFT_1445088 [Hydnum rufescens UP504]